MPPPAPPQVQPEGSAAAYLPYLPWAAADHPEVVRETFRRSALRAAGAIVRADGQLGGLDDADLTSLRVVVLMETRRREGVRP